MLNQFVIVGKLKELPVVQETSNSVKYAHLTLIVRRNFKNSNNEYEYDDITCTLWRGIAESCNDLCKVGSNIAIKGRIQTNPYTSEDNVTYPNYEFIAEKVSILE
ncbi:single-strand DNA-binding protein [Breznakia sp. PF5-3]|uniref:single-stranded DNA-binding protein n=1 Tax=unclassified Breznakia TaxID=2623764 RepID=UPI00240562DD|nr:MULTISPECIES: single-stranded DNA-binding protein [unclassified Breznakia]MDF9823931.1 single-strand DNA-binding protein [Breznakia sp. PM6-1]MDF9834730.1 single-strand DNA-binding protein [Breznakia sp. PF5-3]MDF9836835.1 single-strand DNA-binding protein [Breznakia sp. PFB2-8]MDF9858852.1 single-strand DNA-binding protein [Breznakia sp. PH5-24]